MQSQLQLLGFQESPKAATKDHKPKGKPKAATKDSKAIKGHQKPKGKQQASPKVSSPKAATKPKESPWHAVLADKLNKLAKGYAFKVKFNSHKKQACLIVVTIPYKGWDWTYITSRIEVESNKFMLAGCPASLYGSIQPTQSQINDIDECNFSLHVTEDKASRKDLPLLSENGFDVVHDAVRLALKSKPKSYKLKVEIGEIGTCLYSKDTEPKFVRDFRKEEEERLASYGYGATF